MIITEQKTERMWKNAVVANTLVLSYSFHGNGKEKNDVISRPKLEFGITEHEAEVLALYHNFDFRDERISTCRTKIKKTRSQSR